MVGQANIPSLQQSDQLPSTKQIDAVSNWLVVMESGKSIKELPYSEQITARQKHYKSKEYDDVVMTVDFSNTKHSHISFVSIKAEQSAYTLLGLAKDLYKEHTHYPSSSVGIVVLGFDEAEKVKIAESMIAAVAAANAELPSYQSKSTKQHAISSIKLYGVRHPSRFKQTLAEAEGNALARSLSVMPSNKLTPADYVKIIKPLAKENGWKFEFLDTATLKKKKAGAFLAVAQASPTQDAGIVKLTYTPKKPSRKGKVALVGKGICYDTGGTNLKPANYMFGMHEDMQGSAVALGSLLALTRVNFNRPVECWLALAINHIGPKAYKPNDVITASDGTTIEIVHTDAEGRMVLSDTLAMASKTKPELIMDYATLTGACIYSIGEAYSGVFTNQKNWWPKLIEAGEKSGERVWPFPLDEDFDDMIKSDIADVKQCSRESGVDHILAARFLQRFVKNDTPWIHMDLSASTRKGGLAHIPTDTTGFGVRYTVNWLLGN